MKPYHRNIEKDTITNGYYRDVEYTVDGKMQLVLMSIPPKQDINMETHPDTAQFIRIEKGLGIATINGKHYGLSNGHAIIIPPLTPHRIENVGKTPLKLYTIYSKPEHENNLVQKTRKDIDVPYSKPNPVIAVAYIEQNTIKGAIEFSENVEGDNVLVEVNLTGLPPNSKLGFHVHEAGDLTDGCKSACTHFNPYKQNHGSPKSKIRHVGDLGNLITDSNGTCTVKFYDSMIKLSDETQNIIGRSIVIHEKEDDLGLGKNSESLKTGNSGGRIACSVIGYSKKMFA
jgi:Cu-Zn family superoxide dismutase